MEKNGEDWQTNSLNVLSRNQHILETGLWSDCSFLVGEKENQKELVAHKIILSMASPIFEKMFNGNFENKDYKILVPDISPTIFSYMLRYIYTDNLEIDSVELAGELLYATEKYILVNASKICFDYIYKSLNLPNDILKAYEISKLFEENNLKKKCLHAISNKTIDILSSDSFMDIGTATLLEIFSLETLKIDSELYLVNIFQKFIEKNRFDIALLKDDNSISTLKENQTNIDIDIGNQTNCDIENLRKAFRQIRFLILSPQQLYTVVSKKLFTDLDALAMFMCVSKPAPIDIDSIPEGFSTSTKNRNPLIFNSTLFQSKPYFSNTGMVEPLYPLNFDFRNIHNMPK